MTMTNFEAYRGFDRYRLVDASRTGRIVLGTYMEFDDLLRDIPQHPFIPGRARFFECCNEFGSVLRYVNLVDGHMMVENTQYAQLDESPLNRPVRTPSRLLTITHAVELELRIQYLSGKAATDDDKVDDDWHTLITKYLDIATQCDTNEAAYEAVIRMLGIGFAYAAKLLRDSEYSERLDIGYR